MARTRRPPMVRGPEFALLAQLVEHFHGKEGVNGSSPLEGSRFSASLSQKAWGTDRSKNLVGGTMGARSWVFGASSPQHGLVVPVFKTQVDVGGLERTQATRRGALRSC
jgi:hypothetical protein